MYNQNQWYHYKFWFSIIEDKIKLYQDSNLIYETSYSFTSFQRFFFGLPQFANGKILIDNLDCEFTNDPHTFENEPIGSFPSDETWYRSTPVGCGTITIGLQASPYYHVLDLYKSGGTTWIYTKNFAAKTFTTTSYGSIAFDLNTNTALIFYFYSEGGQVGCVSFYNLTVYSGVYGYGGIETGTYTYNQWIHCELQFNIEDHMWVFKMGGVQKAYSIQGGGSGKFTYIYIGSFYFGSYTTGHINIDNLDYEFKSYYPVNFEYIPIGNRPLSPHWGYSIPVGCGIITTQQGPGTGGTALDLYKNGGITWIYARNYPTYALSCDATGEIQFSLLLTTAAQLHFYGTNGWFEGLFFNGGDIKRNDYLSGPIIGHYSINIWYTFRITFNLATGTWTIYQNANQLIVVTTGTNFGTYSSTIFGSFNAGIPNGHIWVDNINYLF